MNIAKVGFMLSYRAVIDKHFGLVKSLVDLRASNAELQPRH